MFCKKCGSTIRDGAKFCPKCGETVTSASTQSDISNNSIAKAVNAKIQSKTPMISSLCIVIFSLIMISMDKRSDFDYSDVILPVLPCFLVWLYSTVLIIKGMTAALKTIKIQQHMCPKCRKITLHNKYGVCDVCKLDSIADAKFALFTDVVSAILLFIGVSDAFTDTYLIMLIIICILNVLCILSTIYMYPTKLARRTEHTAATAIFWLNIFCGWTFIMWIVLMIWASNGRTEKAGIIQQNVVPQKSAQDSFEELKRLKDMGMITEDEFEAKRKELLTRI